MKNLPPRFIKDQRAREKDEPHHFARMVMNSFDEEALGHMQFAQGQFSSDPAQALAQQRERHLVNAAIAALPPSMREVIVLREIEGLDYKDISHIAGIPMGTVMSRLSRARNSLREVIGRLRKES